ncbi:hypothetical protein CAPTEDRAFT_164106 [Capitella teleta]|uniref:NADH dehydrogenase [ubiquinone] 1 alpha subcomplex subunit 12 n=1 Tax=Capitella teleta TaxID=283909 RepID=R7TR67_CAPTE|nr:hypothetical protein CAPTEDRAFT_164106 [Capitella teleta]|eukprot:ELT96072.1 hypothetical protein CAPTEDRAFT_164106 [Capitella teleta]
MSVYLSKWRNLSQAIKQRGGIIGSILHLYRTDDLKYGDLVGEDKFGNKYYQNDMFFIASNRWVDYAPQFGMDYDGSQIPAEWHRWMHHMTDDPPTVVPPVNYKWLPLHKENKTGTAGEYVPYSTTRPRIQAWQPPSKA